MPLGEKNKQICSNPGPNLVLEFSCCEIVLKIRIITLNRIKKPQINSNLRRLFLSRIFFFIVVYIKCWKCKFKKISLKGESRVKWLHFAKKTLKQRSFVSKGIQRTQLQGGVPTDNNVPVQKGVKSFLKEYSFLPYLLQLKSVFFYTCSQIELRLF